ncbi:MAG: hypothetical protein EXR28_12450 [Betaproteobacteria bacterium]|nr:hypothetical protein [Betaproteobacteria bacterium]
MLPVSGASRPPIRAAFDGQTGHLYFAQNRTFLLCSDISRPEIPRIARLGRPIGVMTTIDLTISSSLIYGGVMDAYPKLKIAICHGGGYLPYYIGRHDWIYGYRSEVSDRVKMSL